MLVISMGSLSERLRSLGLTSNAEARCCTLLGPRSLPVVVAQPDNRLKTEPFCVGVI